MKWPLVKTGRNPLVKLNHTVLNRPTTEGDQINYNYIQNDKVENISDMPYPPKMTRIYKIL